MSGNELPSAKEACAHAAFARRMDVFKKIKDFMGRGLISAGFDPGEVSQEVREELVAAGYRVVVRPAFYFLGMYSPASVRVEWGAAP